LIWYPSAKAGREIAHTAATAKVLLAKATNVFKFFLIIINNFWLKTGAKV
jgi:hypothetical protein